MENTPKAIREGELTLGTLKMKVYVLDNGQRIIESESFNRFMEYLEKGEMIQPEDAEKFARDLQSF